MSKVWGGALWWENNFSLWQTTAKEILIQQELIKALYGKTNMLAIMFNDEWEELEMNVVSTMCLSLVLRIKYSVLNETSPQ